MSLRERLGPWSRSRLPKPLTFVVELEREETDAVRRRRRRVVAGTSVLGAGLLGASLSTTPGSSSFYRSTAAVAGVWTIGGLASGPLHLGWIENRDSSLRRPVLTPAVTGVGAFGVFYGAALVARRIPVLRDAISGVLRFADEGDDRLVLATTLANGLGEEVFFRGAMYAVLEDRAPVAASTAVYALATTTTRNPALVLAAGVMGTLFGLQRRASGGLQAPVITHLTWSTLMLRFLPPLFAADARVETRSSAGSTHRRGRVKHRLPVGSATPSRGPQAGRR
ncbi:membrane protease YdiL (CAAX protease family) [Marmoricola sp. OAE513]|uniref:CPBP family intramembrane glutamic endopeptidase n=1 Tax=Marmoricola sp. OAE513 TaxID=2817894 RepID=UPI001AEA5CF0